MHLACRAFMWSAATSATGGEREFGVEDAGRSSHEALFVVAFQQAVAAP
jgi:hypothetical protein